VILVLSEFLNRLPNYVLRLKSFESTLEANLTDIFIYVKDIKLITFSFLNWLQPVGARTAILHQVLLPAINIWRVDDRRA
jgi:hypothetical protein